MCDLARILDIPDPFITRSRFHFTALEALCILLARFRSAGDQYDLQKDYCRTQSAISEVVNELCEYLNRRWSHLLDFDHEHLLSRKNLSRYARAAYRHGAPIRTIWGFIDCTIRAMCHPTWFQRQGYSGHKKVHALKYQAVVLVNGIIAHLFGPEVGRHNDNHLLATSGLLEKCAEHAIHPNTHATLPPLQRRFQLFGDPAYGISPLLMSPFARNQRTEEELEWNVAMASVRIEVEHAFGGVVRAWPFLNAWWKHRVYSSPLGLYYRVGVLLTNALNCIRPNQTSQVFDCEPPTLEEYFHD